MCYEASKYTLSVCGMVFIHYNTTFTVTISNTIKHSRSKNTREKQVEYSHSDLVWVGFIKYGLYYYYLRKYKYSLHVTALIFSHLRGRITGFSVTYIRLTYNWLQIWHYTIWVYTFFISWSCLWSSSWSPQSLPKDNYSSHGKKKIISGRYHLS